MNDEININDFWINIFCSDKIIATIFDIKEIEQDENNKFRLHTKDGSVSVVIKEGRLEHIDRHQKNIYVE